LAKSNRASSGISEAGISEAGISEAGIPEAGIPDAGIPDAGVSESAVNEDGPRDLDALRRRIDEVDREILARLNERADLVLEVGRAKQSTSTAVYQPAREEMIVESLEAANAGPFPDAGLGPVFREIISATRSLEEAIDVAYLGPEGTFSHLAASEEFGEMASLRSSSSIADIFTQVERGKATLGVVPVENTTEGIVTATFDAFATSVDPDLTICGEIARRISNDLMSKSGVMGDVRCVASHPQPLAQCRDWLGRNLPKADRIETASTAAAAALAAEDGDVAAIGSRIAARVYGLETVEAAIEDCSDNTTRFLIIGKQAPQRTDNDFTSAIFTIRRDEAGGLHRLLEPFASRSINLLSIQLRPIAGKPWEYHFFLDFEGNSGDSRVAEAIAEASKIAHSVRVLGSFPRVGQTRSKRVAAPANATPGSGRS